MPRSASPSRARPRYWVGQVHGQQATEQIERLGLTLMRQSDEITRLRKEFGLEEEDLNLDLGPLGRLL